ncbi:unnamed protein product [Somion occarium]|uniref:Transmembrane protein n=1 Tax=Somion occarium TaxID=3059160 RepID=A0ABP1DV40_9APHY
MVALAQGQSHQGAPTVSPLEIRTLEEFHNCDVVPIFIVGGRMPYLLQLFSNGVLVQLRRMGDAPFYWNVTVITGAEIEMTVSDGLSPPTILNIGPFVSLPPNTPCTVQAIVDPASSSSSIENTYSSLAASSTISVVPSSTTSSFSPSSSESFTTLAPSTFAPTSLTTNSISSLSASGISSKLIGFIVLGAVLFLLLVVPTTIWVWRRNRRRPTASIDLSSESEHSDFEDGHSIRTVQSPVGQSTTQSRPTSLDRMIGNINDSRLATDSQYRQSRGSIGSGPKHDRWRSNRDTRDAPFATDSASYLSSRVPSPFPMSQVSDSLVIDTTSSKNRPPVDAVPHSVPRPGAFLFARAEDESVGMMSTPRREADAGIILAGGLHDYDLETLPPAYGDIRR